MPAGTKFDFIGTKKGTRRSQRNLYNTQWTQCALHEGYVHNEA